MEEPPIVNPESEIVNLPPEPEWDDYFDPGPPPEAPPPPPSFGEYPADPQTFAEPPSNRSTSSGQADLLTNHQTNPPTHGIKIADSEPIYTRRPAEEHAPRTTISVAISSSSNWMAIIRQTVEIASRYSGRDCLVVEIADQNRTIDFPNCKTRASDEMLNLLRDIPGIIEITLLEQAPV